MHDEPPHSGLSLSVVIPTLGRDTLIPTVESVLRARHGTDLPIFVVGHIAAPEIAGPLRTLMRTHSLLRHLDVSFSKGDSSEKKNVGWRAATTELVAFLDDDVVVAPDWPARMVEAFDDPGTALVSGPGLVPPDAPRFARLAGLALSSPAAGYVAWRYRHAATRVRAVNWSGIIGCNMAYRRQTLEALGGFSPDFWPGEEMLASYQAERAGARLVFASDAWVYHYPRQSLSRFVRQIFGYGATRIRLMRAGVQCEPATLVPGLFVAAWVAGLATCVFSPFIQTALIGLWIAYTGVVLTITALTVRETRQVRDVLLCFIIPVLHLSYGVGEWTEWLRPNRDLGM